MNCRNNYNIQKKSYLNIYIAFFQKILVSRNKTNSIILSKVIRLYKIYKLLDLLFATILLNINLLFLSSFFKEKVLRFGL